MYANLGDKHALKHKTNQILFLFAKQTYMNKQKYYSPFSKENKYFSPLSKEKHAYILNTSPPFCQSSTKGLK